MKTNALNPKLFIVQRKTIYIDSKVLKMGKGKTQSKDIANLGKQAKEILLGLKQVRAQIIDNENELKRLVSKKAKREDSFNVVLRQRFQSRQRALAGAKSKYKRQETNLKRKIDSLNAILAVYHAKKAKVEGAKKHYAELQKQMDNLNKKLSIWG